MRRNFGTIDVQLASSRNGAHWNRAGDETGTMVTRRFRRDGGPLTINASARGGLVGVAVLDEDFVHYQGFSR